MFRLFLSAFLCLFLLGTAGAEKSRSIKVINEPLPNVLQKITKSSGIHFKVSDALMEEKVSAKIQESDWDEVVLKLLNNFNMVELRDGKGYLIKVHVLGLKNKEFAVKTANEAIQFKKRPLKKSEIWLNVNQLRELAKGPFRSPLPAHMLHDTELRNFLSLHGITSDEEMNNIQRAMRVRVAARRQLKMLQKK
jgi:type II secretory pathway component GspD/PulD (secretin)